MKRTSSSESAGAATSQRTYPSRVAPTFTSHTGWDLRESTGDSIIGREPCFGPLPHEGGSGGLMSRSLASFASPWHGGMEASLQPVSLLRDHRLPSASADHVTAVFCTSNGRQSIRNVVEYGALDTLGFIHSAAGVTARHKVRYPYNAKGLPETSDYAIPLMRSALSFTINNTKVFTDGCDVRRLQVLDMQRGTVDCDEVRITSIGQAFRVRTTRFASAAAPDTAAVRVVVALENAQLGMCPVRVAYDALIDTIAWDASVTASDDANANEFALSLRSKAGAEPYAKASAAVSVTAFTICVNGQRDAVPTRIVSRSEITQRALSPVVAEVSTTSDTGAATTQAHALRYGSNQSWTAITRRELAASLDDSTSLVIDLVYRIARELPNAGSSQPASETRQRRGTAVHHDPLTEEEGEPSSSLFDTLLASHEEAMARLWCPVGRTSPHNELLAETLLSSATSDNRSTAALRHAVYVLLTNAVGLGPGVPLTSSGLSADGAGGLCGVASVAMAGPALLYTAPHVAERLLRSFVSMIPQGRLNARNQSIRGCLFPAHTVDGSDAVPYFINSAPRIHVTCDVALFALKFLRATLGGLAAVNDRDPAFAAGIVSAIYESATAVLEYGTWDPVLAVFRLDSVTGFDEYNPLVDDHVYTHVGVAALLGQAATLLETEPLLQQGGAAWRDLRGVSVSVSMTQAGSTGDEFNATSRSQSNTPPFGSPKSNHTPIPESCAEALAHMGFERRELLEMLRRAASSIVITRDDATRVYFPHNGFDGLPLLAPESVVGHPLSLHIHPLVIYRHKVCQVPDVLIAMLLHPTAFDADDLERAVRYYRPLCTRDVPWALGIETAADFRAFGDSTPESDLLETLLHMTLDHTFSEAVEGLRIAPLCSSWFALAFGVLGFRESPETGELSFSPTLPVGWTRVRVPFVSRGASFVVDVSLQSVEYRHGAGATIRLRHRSAGGGASTAAAVCLGSSLPPVEFPRTVTRPVSPQFDGVILLIDAIVQSFHELNFEAWRSVLSEYFELAKVQQYASPAGSPKGSFEDLSALEARLAIPPLTLEEYAQTFLGATTKDFGQMRYAGLESILHTRNIDIPLGTAEDAVVSETRFGLANAKLVELQAILRNVKLAFIPGVLELLRSLKREGLRVALVTFSRSGPDFLQQLPEIQDLVCTCITGTEARALRVGGRPHTDLFSTAATKLHLLPQRCVVIGSQLDRGYRTDEFLAFAGAINVRWEHDLPNSPDEPLERMPFATVQPQDMPRSLEAIEAKLRKI
jgi:trehalose/maltose hydrolase-like predicted phosphorylase/beta-phosphoglucomutase-like phosphatase (HAD superfamily)